MVPTFSQYDFIKTGKVPILHSEENSLQDDNKAINSNSDSPFQRPSYVEPEIANAILNWGSANTQLEVETKKQIRRNYDVTEMRILHFMTYLEDNNFYKDQSRQH